MEKLTFTLENYLEAVYKLTLNNKGARVSDISEILGVSKASTNRAMNSLAEKKLVINERYGGIYLTELGKEYSKQTYEKHKLLYNFLTECLGVEKNIADEDACEIEHVISDVSFNALKKFVDKYLTEEHFKKTE